MHFFQWCHTYTTHYMILKHKLSRKQRLWAAFLFLPRCSRPSTEWIASCLTALQKKGGKAIQSVPTTPFTRAKREENPVLSRQIDLPTIKLQQFSAQLLVVFATTEFENLSIYFLVFYGQHNVTSVFASLAPFPFIGFGDMHSPQRSVNVPVQMPQSVTRTNFYRFYSHIFWTWKFKLPSCDRNSGNNLQLKFFFWITHQIESVETCNVPTLWIK